MPDIYPNIRRKISQACEDFGLIRIQYSVFWGTMTASQARDLGVRCVTISNNVPIDIRFIAVCSSCFSKSFAVIHNSLLNTYGTSPLNSNPIYSAVGHHDVGWGIVNPNSNPIPNPNPNPPAQPVPVSQALMQVPSYQSPSQIMMDHDSSEDPQVLPLQEPSQHPEIPGDKLDSIKSRAGTIESKSANIESREVTHESGVTSNPLSIMDKKSNIVSIEPTAEDLIKMMGYNDMNQFDKEVSKALRPKKSRSKKTSMQKAPPQKSIAQSLTAQDSIAQNITPQNPTVQKNTNISSNISQISSLNPLKKSDNPNAGANNNVPSNILENDIGSNCLQSEDLFESITMKGKVVNFDDMDIEFGTPTGVNLMEPQFGRILTKGSQTDNAFLKEISNQVNQDAFENCKGIDPNSKGQINPIIKGSVHRGSVDIDVFIV